MNFLMRAHGMASATDVILTGGSSGGMAVYLVCDRIADHIRAANPKIRVTCLADAGMFLDHPAASGRPTLSPQFIDSFYACEPHATSASLAVVKTLSKWVWQGTRAR